MVSGESEHAAESSRSAAGAISLNIYPVAMLTLTRFLAVLSLAIGVSSPGAEKTLTAQPVSSTAQPGVGFGKVAARPLFRDPPFDAPTDPVLCFNAEAGKWYM